MKAAKVRLYVDHPLGEGQSVPVDRDQAHYLFGVMRLGVGDFVSLFNGEAGDLLRGWLLLPLAGQRPTEPVPIHLPHPQRQRWQVVGELRPNHRRLHDDCSDCAHRRPLPEKEQDCSSLACSSSHHHLALQRLPKAKALLRHNAPTDQDLYSGRQGERSRWQYPRLPLREGKVSAAIDA